MVVGLKAHDEEIVGGWYCELAVAVLIVGMWYCELEVAVLLVGMWYCELEVVVLVVVTMLAMTPTSGGACVMSAASVMLYIATD